MTRVGLEMPVGLTPRVASTRPWPRGARRVGLPESPGAYAPTGSRTMTTRNRDGRNSL